VLKDKKLINLCIVLFINIIIQLHCSVYVQAFEDNESDKFSPVKAEVIEITSSEEPQEVNLSILEGKFSGKNIILKNEIILSCEEPLVLKKGDKVLVCLKENESGELAGGYIVEFVREKYLLYLSIAFVFFLIIIGGFKGIKSIITLLITGAAIIKILLPGILKGQNPTTLSIGIAIGITIITLVILNGFSKKSFVAIIGTAGGVIVAGFISSLVIRIANISGLSEESNFMLGKISQSTHLDFKGLLFSAIILGALGAVMDVSMSIASALHEIKENNPQVTSKEIIQCGMNIGKDIMGTMANTLILAYAGSSLNLLLLYMTYDVSFVQFINKQEISTEILRALAGSIGLIFTIPITIMAAVLLKKDKHKRCNN
jgi:uncharacterized membrane protein